MDLRITIQEDAGSPLAALAATLQRKTELNKQIGRSLRNLVSDHLVKYEAAHPNKLGGPRTNYWGKAASAVSVQCSDTAATLTINTPGIRRAFEDVSITAGARNSGVKNLAIPNIAAAYGRSPASVSGLVPLFRKGRVMGLIEGEQRHRRHKGKHGQKGGAYLAEKPGGLVWYWFVPSVIQPQDPTLMPTTAELNAAARAAAASFLESAQNGPAK